MRNVCSIAASYITSNIYSLWNGNDREWKGYKFTITSVMSTIIQVLIINSWNFTEIPLPGQTESTVTEKTFYLLAQILPNVVLEAVIGFIADYMRSYFQQNSDDARSFWIRHKAAITCGLVAAVKAFMENTYVLTGTPLPGQTTSDVAAKIFYMLGIILTTAIPGSVRGVSVDHMIEAYNNRDELRPML